MCKSDEGNFKRGIASVRLNKKERCAESIVFVAHEVKTRKF